MHAVHTFLVTSLLALSATVAAEPISFRHLPPGASLEVGFRSSGCFHQTDFAFHFERAADQSVHVTVHDLQNSKKLGSLALSESDLVGLDNLMKAYRHLPLGGCTTEDTLTLVQKKDGKAVASETITDSTCDISRRKDLLQFATLTERLKKQGK